MGPDEERVEPGSALLLPVAEVEGLVGRWRRLHDPSARAGVPAHVTVLYPFMAPPSIGPTELSILGEVFRSVPALGFELVATRRFENEGVIYLAPEPVELFVNLTLAVADRFPDWPPYEGRYLPDVVPHLTITQGAPKDVLDAIERELTDSLPLACKAHEILLMTGSNARSWNVAHRWRLRQSRERPDRVRRGG